ncbi:unnamed protein product [Microthlaspi erraticum]|uniref:Retrotransposon Copia-like N-terminal domain-containing protein n=1 Tax=Microthlaspi erraticum TaxID=1685480 RepID=A0A6D2KAB5_9BRAS|nr:unnamed protein product [Microthlaspi erraticum]
MAGDDVDDVNSSGVTGSGGARDGVTGSGDQLPSGPTGVLPRAEMPNPEENLKVYSPYELAPSENPGTAISPVLLNGENYAEWASELENALRDKRKSGFINGTLSRPIDKPRELEAWNTVNSMIVGWIRASISPKIRSTVTFTSDAHKLWIDLMTRFSVGNGVRVHQLKSELASCRQEGMSVMDYFGKLSSKWEELLNYKPLPHCTCSWNAKFMQDYEEERVHQFLMGLDESRFGNVVTNIIGTEPLPELNSVYQKVVQEERRLNSSRGEVKQEAVGFMTVKTEQPQTIRAVEKNQNGSQGDRGGRGNSSRGRGGFSPGRGRGGFSQQQFRSNAAQASSPSLASSLPSFTADQWAALSQLIDQQKPTTVPDRLNGNNQTGEVILDTGASHHMTGDASILT